MWRYTTCHFLKHCVHASIHPLNIFADHSNKKKHFPCGPFLFPAQVMVMIGRTSSSSCSVSSYFQSVRHGHRMECGTRISNSNNMNQNKMVHNGNQQYGTSYLYYNQQQQHHSTQQHRHSSYLQPRTPSVTVVSQQRV